MSWSTTCRGGMILVALGSGCSGSSDSKPGESEQTTGSELPAQSGSSGGTSGGSASNAGNASRLPCSVVEPAPIVEGELMSLNLMGDALYFVDRADGTPIPGLVDRYFGAIKRYDLASNETTTLFTTEDSYIDDLLVTADSLYVATRHGTISDVVDIVRQPLSGQGTAVPVSPAWSMDETAFRRSVLVGVAGNELVVEGAAGTMALSLADGSVRSLLPPSDSVRDELVSVQLLGNQLWYATEQGRGGIFRLDVSAPGSMPVEVYPEGCPGTTLGMSGWFLVGGSELSCGGSRAIQDLALDGSGEGRSWDLAAVDPDPYYPAYSGANALYLASGDSGVRVPGAGGNAEYFSCEAVPVDGITGNADWFVWGRNSRTSAGVVGGTTPVLLNPNVLSAIHAQRR